MVFRTIEIKELSFEVEKERQGDVVNKIRELYPDLKVEIMENNVIVSGDLRNYKKRDNIIDILRGSEDGQDI